MCLFVAVPDIVPQNLRAAEIGDTYAVLQWDMKEYQSFNTTTTALRGEFRGFKVRVVILGKGKRASGNTTPSDLQKDHFQKYWIINY